MRLRALLVRRFASSGGGAAGAQQPPSQLRSLRERVRQLQERASDLSQYAGLAAARGRLQQLEREAESPAFWQDAEAARAAMQALAKTRETVQVIDRLQERVGDAVALLQLCAEEEADALAREELARDVQQIEEEARRVEFLRFFTQPEDAGSCFLELHAGAGGKDAEEWTGMLARVYTRWAERAEFAVQLVDESRDGTLVKKAALRIDGPYAYGWLRLERGAHRLIRFSPFKANSQRHTSLCGVDVVPAAARAGAAPIVIGRGDVRVDTFRAQGAGGQHVNTTESAVRITHIPTGISVKCQQERSQMQNRALAMEWLRAKLQQRSEEALRAQHVEADAPDFGATVVRTVYLHPAQMVKDHRTGAESRDVDAFLDGDMTASLEAALRHASSASAVASACSTP